MKEARETIDKINKFHSDIVKQRTTPDRRIIGQIAHLEPIDVNNAPHEFTKDWALIELYDAKFDWATFKGNTVYVGTFFVWTNLVLQF